MKKQILIATILLYAVPVAHARDAYFEAAEVMFYDNNCAKLPADFVKAKIKGATGGATKEARKYSASALKDAQDSMQATFDTSGLSMKDFCVGEELNIKCSIYSYRHGDKIVNCRTLK
jgi:hypothetical protein